MASEPVTRGRRGAPAGTLSHPEARAAARRALSSPHLALAAGAAIVLGIEWLRGSATVDTSVLFPLVQAAVAASALAAACLSKDKLRLWPVLALGLAFQLAWIGIHLHLGVQGDTDAIEVYPREGQALLDGHYPLSEYPPGAVVLFAFETWLGGGSARTANALLMIPFQLLCVASLWAFRMRWSSWLAAALALWPANAFFWEFRFDLVPAAGIVAGCLLAHRGHWAWAGFVLGLGAVVKWTPALVGVALLLWLVRSRRLRAAARYVAAAAVPVFLADAPLALLDRKAFVWAYATQNGRPVSAESLPYLPLRLLGIAHAPRFFWQTAILPGWTTHASFAVQLLILAAAAALVLWVPSDRGAIALAALLPSVFLLSNRIFSPQFFIVILASLLVAAGLVARGRRELLTIASLCAVATAANEVLYPSFAGRPLGEIPGWTFVSAAVFLPSIAATVWLLVRAVQAEPDGEATAREA